MIRLIKFITNFYEDNQFFIKEVIIPICFIIVVLFIVYGCRKETPPVEPKGINKDSLMEEISQKKLNYIYHSIREEKKNLVHDTVR